MSTEENQSEEEEKFNELDDPLLEEPQKRKKWFIILGVVIITLLVYFFIRNITLKNEVEMTQGQLDISIKQLDSISAELDNRILTISELEGNVDTLLKIKEELEIEKQKLLAVGKTNQKTIQNLREKVKGYGELLVLKDKEIEKLQKQAQVLLDENTNLKTEKNQLSDSIVNLVENKKNLQSKIALASQLKALDVTIFSVNKKGKERKDRFKPRHIAQLKITFDIDENQIAPIESKDILIRIVKPDNSVLFDVNKGSGTFTFKGRELFYTLKEEIMYTREREYLTFNYEEEIEYSEGKYEVEIYTDDYLMGRGSFTVY